MYRDEKNPEACEEVVVNIHRISDVSRRDVSVSGVNHSEHVMTDVSPTRTW